MLKHEKVPLATNVDNEVEVAKLIVQNFSCIKSLEIEFKRLTVFIGEQASGKSVTCKLYYFFAQAFRSVFAGSLIELVGFDVFMRKLEKEFHKIFPESTWLHDSFSIDWSCLGKTVKVSHNKSNKRVTINCPQYKEIYEKALDTANSFFTKKQKGINVEEVADARWQVNRFVSRYVTRTLRLSSVDYIPAGRSFFSTIQDNVFALLSDNIGIDYFLKEFGRKIEAWKSSFYYPGIQDNLEEYRQILHGAYHFDGKEQWIVRDKNHKVRLADASSGQQEVFPLLLILHNLTKNNYPYSRRVVIEEPEAHLFPTAQMEIVELLRRLMHKTPTLGFVITTHSPFILCCLNNLISKSKFLSGAISAYHLYNGAFDDLYDTETRLINAERFDNISSDIANG